MAYINLLPWREEALKAKQKEFYTILTGVSVLAFLLVLLINFYYQARIDGQVARNQFLQNKIQLLDVKIAEIKTLNEKKAALQKRIDAIEQLQRNRNVGTKVFDELAKIIPNGIYITQLDKQGASIQLAGKSESNNHLANMIRAIELSDLFTDATPESITTGESNSKFLSNFKMKVTIKGIINETDKDSVDLGGVK